MSVWFKCALDGHFDGAGCLPLLALILGEEVLNRASAVAGPAGQFMIKYRFEVAPVRRER
jgi:hypothetical protein